MTIAVGADHAGVGLKHAIIAHLQARGVDVVDVGTHDATSVDYPDFAADVARRVASGTADCGILICGTGIGMAIAANKFRGIRAAPVYTVETARVAREHNDLNILALGARTTDAALASEIVTAFLDTPFAGHRHTRRIDKITALDPTP